MFQDDEMVDAAWQISESSRRRFDFRSPFHTGCKTCPFVLLKFERTVNVAGKSGSGAVTRRKFDLKESAPKRKSINNKSVSKIEEDQFQ